MNLYIVMGIWCFFVLEKITNTYFASSHDHGHHGGSNAAKGKTVADQLVDGKKAKKPAA